RPGKTEIHPITSLLVKRAAPEPRTRRFEFFVFADEGHRPVGFPDPIGAGESHVGDFAIAAPLGSAMKRVAGGGEGMAESVSFVTESRGSYAILMAQVSSVKPDNGKGFYHVVFDVPALFSVRAFVDSPWDLNPSGPCVELASELEKMKRGEFDPELK